MSRKIKMCIGVISLIIFTMPFLAFAQKVGVFFDSNVAQIKFAAGDVKAALESKNFTVEMLPLTSLNAKYANKKVVIAIASNSTVTKVLTRQGGTIPTGVGEQAYCLRTTKKGQTSYWVLGGDLNGAMYGGFQIAENILQDGFSGAYTNIESPFLLARGMKLNLPLDKRIPTYIGKWTSNSAKKAIPHVWDITFWKKLIDQQARNRYNVLSVWVHHPFPALVKLADYPKVSLPNIEGFDGYVNELNHEQRVVFWREVMKYAHDRGMKFYFFNWNLYVDYAEDQYATINKDTTNTTTIDYTYKSMRALIDTYPELDGFGISAGDGLSGSFVENTTWTWSALGKAVKDYFEEHPSRKFNLIHRSIRTSPEVLDSIYAPLKTVPNVTLDFSVKYAMAHTYSTPTPKWTAGEIEGVAKLGMKTWLTVRNDDYFYFNWGDPKFVRDFMYGIPSKEKVVGIYIGIDGYNPSRTYFCKNEALNGQLEVERRWYMEMLWGRISYNPQVSDNVFKNMFAKRFPTISADNLFQAWTLASRPLPKVTELVMGAWIYDFHWYPEACWSSAKSGGFRTIDGFANQTTVAQGSNLCDIPTSAAGNCQGKKSSYTVADEMLADAEKALSLINTIKSDGSADLDMAVQNVKQMAYLSSYYAYKVRGATYKKAGQIENAREAMGKAYHCWINYTRTMDETYHPDSFRIMAITPDWKFADTLVLKEYTDLGGIGIPDNK